MRKAEWSSGSEGAAWDLSGLYEGVGDSRIQADLNRAGLMARRFAAEYNGKIREISEKDSALLLAAVSDYEAIHETAMQPFFYAYLLQAADTQDHKRNALFQSVKEEWQKISKSILFFLVEIRSLPERVLEKLSDASELGRYRHFLLRAAQWKPHTLSEAEERLLHERELTGRNALVSFFDEFMGALAFKVEAEGKECDLARDQVLSLLYAPDRSLRERAYDVLLKELSRHALTFKHIFNTLLLDKQLDDRERAHPDPFHRPHLEKEADPVAIENMMKAVESFYPLAGRYFRIKADALGLKRLKNTDLLAPLGGAEIRIPYEEAKRIMREALGALHPIFYRRILEFFEHSRVDAEARKGKLGGAFCACLSPSLKPYVSLTYTGAVRDLCTLAHELGHGIHSALASNQPFLNFEPSLLLAETASTFCELLLISHLLEKDSAKDLHLSLLTTRVDGAVATVFRQTVLTRFEQAAHAVRRDRLMSVEEISDLWWKENEKLYGEEVEMIPSYRWGWAYVPHFVHQPFYCYSYIFGYLVSVSLLNAYLAEEKPFLEKVIHLLRAGSSKSPAALLSEFGWNPRERSFWEGPLKTISSWVDAVEEELSVRGRSGRGTGS